LRNPLEPLKLTTIRFRDKIRENSTPEMPVIIALPGDVVFLGGFILMGRVLETE
jgi:hypothetical protein